MSQRALQAEGRGWGIRKGKETLQNSFILWNGIRYQIGVSKGQSGCLDEDSLEEPKTGGKETNWILQQSRRKAKVAQATEGLVSQDIWKVNWQGLVIGCGEWGREENQRKPGLSHWAREHQADQA